MHLWDFNRTTDSVIEIVSDLMCRVWWRRVNWSQLTERRCPRKGKAPGKDGGTFGATAVAVVADTVRCPRMGIFSTFCYARNVSRDVFSLAQAWYEEREVIKEEEFPLWCLLFRYALCVAYCPTSKPNYIQIQPICLISANHIRARVCDSLW